MGARGRPERREKSAWKSMVSRGNRMCKDMGLSPRLYFSSPFLNEQRGRQDNDRVACMSPVRARPGACPVLHSRSCQSLASHSAERYSPERQVPFEAGEATVQSRRVPAATSAHS